jgi:hypothetical protein
MNQVASISPQMQTYPQNVQNDASRQPMPIAQRPTPVAQLPMPVAQPQSVFQNTGPTNLMYGGSQAVPVAVETTENTEEENQNASIVPDVSMGQWTAQSGTSLKTVLESWSNLEGVDLFWSSDFDYPINGDVNISGTYEEAVEALLLGFSEANPKPVGRLHPNLPHGPAVLLIESTKETN